MLKPMKKLENKSKVEKEAEDADKFLQNASNIQQKVLDNKELYTKYVSYVIVAVALIFLYLNYVSDIEKEANGLFGIAMVDYNNQQSEKARQKFEGVLLDYDGTEAAARSNYMLGKIYYEQNIIQQSLAYFLAYDGSDPLFKGASLAGAALCYESEKDYITAAEYYLKASDAEERVQTSLNYKFSAALNYERSNDNDKAKQLLEEILNSDKEFEQKKLVELKLGLL